MQKILVLIALSVCALHAQQETPRPKAGVNFWRASITALGAANVMDAQSSWGKHELNGALSGGSGNFGAQGVLLKIGLQGSLIGLEYLVARRHPSAKVFRALGILNFGAAAGMAGIAAHNYGVAREH